ncbi:MAG: AMP-binding protein [Clostridia bacterium]|nr:AMP-binding protein [Clostridia bacterium]
MFIKDILLSNKNSSKVAIKYSNEGMTYAQLLGTTIFFAELIRSYYTGSKNVGIFLPNSMQYAVAYFTITLLDKVIVPIGIQAKKAEIQSTVEYCELGLIITNNQYIEALKDSLNDTEYMVTIFNIDDESFLKAGLAKKDFENIKESVEIDENSVAIMLHTSGTTSNPKRVMLTHKNLITNIKSNIDSLKLTENDICLIALPMFFGYCNTAQFLTHLYLGATIVIMDEMFIPNSFFKLVQEEGITNFTGVPSMLLMLLSYRNRFKYDISSLRYVCFGGGNMPVEKLKQLIEDFPTVGFVQTYGQTEASPRATCLLPDDSLRKLGSVGKPIPNVKVRIVDDSGVDVGIGQMGEIIIQGDNVMKGYYKRPEETAKVKRNNWLYTGDLGRYDEDGYIYLVGRKKNIIISGGLNIYPEEVEELLMCHPSVKEACVVGEEHDLLGEIPVAKVVLKEPQTVGEGELINYCLENLAGYKAPVKVYFIQEFSKTANGKIKRY